ncbi:reverse transcriptase domain-containing protein [Tanacetum coccineum]
MFATYTTLSLFLDMWNNTCINPNGINMAYGMSWTELKKLRTSAFMSWFNPIEEIQRMEHELWNLKVKDFDISSTRRRFMSRINNVRKWETVIRILNPQAKIMYVAPRHTIDGAKGSVSNRKDSEGNNKRKWESSQGGNNGNNRNNNSDNTRHNQQNNQRQGNARAMTTTLAEQNRYAGNKPLCNRCGKHHFGYCKVVCSNCGKPGHMARDCKGKAIAMGANARPTVTCYDCREKGHIRNYYPKRRDPQGEEARGRAYVIRDAEKHFVNTSFSHLVDINPVRLDTSYEVELSDGRVVWIYQKSQKRQKRASMDTRTEECTKAGSKAKEKSNLSQTVKGKSNSGPPQDRTMKHPKGIAENVLVGIDYFEGRDEKIIFKSVKPASSLIKRVYMLSLRERMDLDLEARLMGETLILNRSFDPSYGDYIELHDLNEPLDLRRNKVDDLEPTVEEGEVVNEPMMDIVKTRFNFVGGLDDYPSNYDFNRRIRINCTYNLKVLCMIVEEDMDPYLDEGMGDVIVEEPFCKASCMEARRFDGIITIRDGDDSVTYQIIRSNPKFKHLTNEKSNKIPPLLKVSKQDKMNGISHSYQKLKGFYKGVLNLGPKFIRDAKVEEWLTRGHINVHEIEIIPWKRISEKKTKNQAKNNKTEHEMEKRRKAKVKKSKSTKSKSTPTKSTPKKSKCMRTRSSSNLVGNSSSNPTTSNPKRRNRRRSKQPFSLEEPPVVTMVDQRTMAELLRAPTEFDESFHEAWDRYKDLLRTCPHHGFIELHQLDTFYNALNPADQDSLNSAADGNLLERSTQDVLTIIENKSKVRNSQNKSIVSQVKSSDGNSSSSDIAKLTHAVNQQTSAVTTAMTAILKQFQATPPPASVKAVEEICVTCGGSHPYYQCLAADGNTFSEYRDNIQGYVVAATGNYNQGNSGYRPPGVVNQIRPSGFVQQNDQNNKNRFSQPQGYNRGNNFNQNTTYQAPIQQNQSVPLSELEKIKKMNDVNIKAMQAQINNVKNELRNEMQSSIQASMSNQTNELKNMMASFFQMNTASTSGTGSLPRNIVDNPKGELKAITTRSGLVLDGPTVPMPPPFINIEEDERVEETLTDPEHGEYTDIDPRVHHILGRTWGAKGGGWGGRSALIDVHGEEMILRDGDEKLTLNMRHDTSSYSNQPHKESINMIDFCNVSYEDYLEDLFATNHLKFKAYLASDSFPPGSDDTDFDPEGDLRLIEELLNNDPSSPLPLSHNPLSGSTTSSSPDHLLEEFADELALINRAGGNRFYSRGFGYEGNLADPNNNLVDTIPKMFIDEHTLDYSSPPLYDDVDDDLVELKSDNDDYDSVLYEDFSEVDALPSTNNEDKVFNPGILIHENLFEVTIRATPDKNVKKISISNASLILEDFNPPLYELPFHKEVPGSETLLSFSSKNEEKVFNPGILTSKGVHTSLLPELSHRGPKAFKVIKIFESPMEIFPCSYGEDIRVLDVPIALDFEASRAHGFVLRSLELQILSFIMGIQYPNLID